VRGLDRGFGHGGLSLLGRWCEARQIQRFIYTIRQNAPIPIMTAGRPLIGRARQPPERAVDRQWRQADATPPTHAPEDAHAGGGRRRVAGRVARVTRAASPAHAAAYFTRIVTPRLSVAAPAPTSP